ncbi:envelope glycoprotein 24 [Panine betaherpesvirus 2]|uniref:Envelope glycoprotein 24 n=1 Tax=Panine betaherpesvirus 2 TaxID=188763 RepID=G9VYW6_9BETA|nr:envelope glycoprotein 24 [Panine betaherpesvirus 2]AEV81014.1 envelope glycoprotein 24 [Panine betaherpesvirus 2]QXV67822.1 envelope glycoprotein 24 [Panine betaherpesvirus 2]
MALARDPAPSVCITVWLALVYSLMILAILLFVYRCVVGFDGDLVTRTLAVYHLCHSQRGPPLSCQHNTSTS